MSTVAGPLGAVIVRVGEQLQLGGHPPRSGANPLVLLQRTAFVRTGPGDGAAAGVELDKESLQCLLRWADDHDLGQQRDLVRAVAARRARAVASLTSGVREHRRLIATPQWHLAVGLGDRLNAHELGLSMHGTYGFPVIPASSVKGVTAAWARDVESGDGRSGLVARVFGTDREGSVRFFDALPVDVVTVSRDLVNPHVQPYYQGHAAPSEYHNPIISEFLVVTGGDFAIDLVGPSADVREAAGWCRKALKQLGVGGKTSAGYGYLTVRPDQPASSS